MSAQPRLVLASGSPRRRHLLEMLDLSFEIRPVDVDETPLDGESPEQLVRRLAILKAATLAQDGEVILAADTIVTLDERILGKPASRSDAVGMLSRLQGREHTVLTGVALKDGTSGQLVEAIDRTEVALAPLDAARVDWYVATDEPLDKAGAYAIQGLGAAFVESIKGNYTNVVGLPLPTVASLLEVLGYDLFDFRPH